MRWSLHVQVATESGAGAKKSSCKRSPSQNEMPGNGVCGSGCLLMLLVAAAFCSIEPCREHRRARIGDVTRTSVACGPARLLRLRGAGMVFRENLDFSAFYAAYPNASIYACAGCGAHVSASAYVLSRKIQGMYTLAKVIAAVGSRSLLPPDSRCIAQIRSCIHDAQNRQLLSRPSRR